MNNPDNPGFTSTTALVDRTTQGPVPVLVPVPHFILESTSQVSYFFCRNGFTLQSTNLCIPQDGAYPHQPFPRVKRTRRWPGLLLH